VDTPRPANRTTPNPFIGRSPCLRRVIAQAERVAPTAASVLITGETGTGKEVMARFLHDRSGRSGPFVAVNCASLPKDLVESELFGHEKGAFTGASEAKRGLIREANAGTLFLDEVGEMPMDVQVKLLRVLQDRKVRPVGGRREESFDVRVVAATLRDLEGEVAEGRFREDLLYRLAAFEVTLPPLRDRGDDVVLLAKAFVATYSSAGGVGARSLGRTAGAALRQHAWPGNLRELQRVLLRAAVLGDGRTIAGADVRRVVGAGRVGNPLDVQLRSILETSNGLSMAQITAALRVPRTSAWRALATLVKEGAAEFLGVGKARRYRVVGRHVAVTRGRGDDASGAVLDMLAASGHVTRRDVVDRTGMPERTAGRLLADLVRRGYLTVTGRGRTAGYTRPTTDCSTASTAQAHDPIPRRVVATPCYR
jgi:DNA-binding NtrC family response regulator